MSYYLLATLKVKYGQQRKFYEVMSYLKPVLEAWSAAPRELLEWSKDKAMDGGIARAHHDLFEKAINAGQGQADFAYLYEVLRKK
jgi:NADPH-dependent reductive aminase-like protein